MKMVEGADEMKKWFIKSHWLEENRIAYIEIIGDMDEDGMEQFNSHFVTEYLDHGIAPVHCIIDAKALTGYPQSLRVLRDGTAKSVKHPSTGWIVLIGFDSPVFRFLVTAVTQVLGVRFKQVESLEEAKNVLRKVDQTLPAEV
jgi:hypothetical protein